MWQRLFNHKFALALFSALGLILAYAPIHLIPLSLLMPFFLGALIMKSARFKDGWWWGFLQSVFLMIGGFYWVVYVIKVFGFLSWGVSSILYLGFCGIGALNIPLFTGVASEIHRRLRGKPLPSYWGSLWYTFALPTLWILFEWAIPKLFPWYLGHAWYLFPAFIQITELTGCLYLSFAMCSLGFLAAAHVFKKDNPFPLRRWAWAIPGALWAVLLGFGLFRLSAPGPAGREMNVAIIQANIGSLERLEASLGIGGKVRQVIDSYERLTLAALAKGPKPDLILWPETAMPFQLEGQSRYAQEIRAKATEWGVPLITGAYAQSPYNRNRDFNAAFLLEPTNDSANPLRLSIAPKNVLLAFGEYMPGGDTFPKLYEWFPQVSNFELGRTQSAFQLKDGTRLGVTICYEAIIPSFVRKVAQLDTHLLLNLTNDSWFGPTSEPYQHAQLSVFRAVETRMPLVRATNTGTSFTVDTFGRMSERTPVYDEGVLNTRVVLPAEPPRTLYVRWGEWFLALCVGFLTILGVVIFRKSHVSLPT